MSNPHTAGISLWDFTDKNAWKHGTGGVIDANMESKLAYDTLQHLIKTEWWSKPQLIQADESGCVSAGRVFKGSYQVTVDDGAGHQKTFEVAVDKSKNTVVLQMPH